MHVIAMVLDEQRERCGEWIGYSLRCSISKINPAEV